MTNRADSPRIVVAGAAGRMGRTLLELIVDREDLVLRAALEQPGSPHVDAPVSDLQEGYPEDRRIVADPADVLEPEDVLIDFTRPDATRSFLDAVQSADARMVIGTTGLSDEDLKAIQRTAERTAIVRAPNMSVGINLLASLVEETTRCLGEEFDVEITETHHRHKEDAPSGTANMLARTVAETRGQQLEDVQKIGRQGFEGERSPEEIGISSLRGGDVVGDHTVLFAGEGERVELTHKASSRKTFARGALRAARFLTDKSSGLYSMQDVLGL